MAEDGERQSDPAREEVQQPSRRDVLRKGWDLGAKAAGLTIARRLLPPALITGMLGQVESADKSIERSNAPVYELPPLPEFQPPERDQRVVVIPMYERGEHPPLTIDRMEEALEFVKSDFEGFSFGKLNYSFKVLPWQEVDLPKDRDRYEKIERIGDKTLRKADVNDPEQYQTRLYVLRPDSKAKWAGVAFPSGWPGKWGKYNRAITQIFDGDEVFSFTGTTIHELGHTLGIPHANSINDLGKSVEYGGSDDPMGSIGRTLGHDLNAPQRVSMGWVPRDQVQSITQDGDYTIYPLDMRYEGVEGITKVLRFQKPDTSERYYLSSRAQGFGNFCLELHRWDEKKKSPSREVVVPVKDRDVGWIDKDEEFYDPKNGIRIKILSRESLYTRTREAGTVRVKITFDKK